MPCTTILVGKKASYDGSTLICRNDDGSFSPKSMVSIDPKKQPRKYKSVIAHLEIQLPDDPQRYTSFPNVIRKKEGLWPACGINASNVAMTATETITSNPRVMGGDPYVKYEEKKKRTDKEVPGGIGEEDLVTLVLPYIHSAREGVLRLGQLLEQYGTYEANGIAFSDCNEIWWMETIGGHHWIARRVPDDRVVLMPNQFGMDNFDFDDACTEKKENLCSADMLTFMKKNHLDLQKEGLFNPRWSFGSHSDSDHIYNTPRAWFMARYFQPRTHIWEGPNAEFTPESDDLPWSLVPEHLVTVEDLKYLLSSHYQGTPYDPYGRDATGLKGKYRVIGVPNSDDSIILQIRNDGPKSQRGIEWVSMGGSGYTASFPIYANVSRFPAYIGATKEDVTTENMYWASRLIAALTDAHYFTGIIHDERYVKQVQNEGRRLLNEYDQKLMENEDEKLAEEANQKIVEMVQKESAAVLKDVLKNASEHMKTRYHRGDN